MLIDSSVRHHKKLQSYTWSTVHVSFLFLGAPPANTDGETYRERYYVQMHILYTSSCCCGADCVCLWEGGGSRQEVMPDRPLLFLCKQWKWRRWAFKFSNSQNKNTSKTWSVQRRRQTKDKERKHLQLKNGMNLTHNLVRPTLVFYAKGLEPPCQTCTGDE